MRWVWGWIDSMYALRCYVWILVGGKGFGLMPVDLGRVLHMITPSISVSLADILRIKVLGH